MWASDESAVLPGFILFCSAFQAWGLLASTSQHLSLGVVSCPWLALHPHSALQFSWKSAETHISWHLWCGYLVPPEIKWQWSDQAKQTQLKHARVETNCCKHALKSHTISLQHRGLEFCTHALSHFQSKSKAEIPESIIWKIVTIIWIVCLGSKY